MSLSFSLRTGISHLARAAVAMGLSTFILSGAAAVPSVVDSVVPGSYVPGDAPGAFQNLAAPLGSLTGDTTYGGLNPFNPPFDPSQILWVGAGGQVTLHLSTPIAPNGVNLGVYSNVGFYDNSTDGSGLTDASASLYNQVSRATVSVSQDGVTFVPLNGGKPIAFPMPTNYYLNAPITQYYQAIPANPVVASQSKPYLGSQSDFANMTYSAITAQLNGSAGGTWLDVRNTVPFAINYVHFDVAANSGDRMVIDALGGVGAANTLTAGGRVISEDVGSGANTSDIVIDFGPQSYDFKVHYNGTITGEQALQLLQANSDFRFSVKSYSFGDLVMDMDYGGYTDSGIGSHGSDYWRYYTGDGSTWSLSGQGAGKRQLTDGSYDGWVWAGAHAGAPNFATVPEPIVGLPLMLSIVLLRRQRLMRKVR